jgi:hypothetical protein
MSKTGYNFEAIIWSSTGKGAWHFVTVPEDIAYEIKFFRQKISGFGSIPVDVKLGQSQWTTSLFPDKASNSFFLPLKSAVRKKEQISVGDRVTILIQVDDIHFI